MKDDIAISLRFPLEVEDDWPPVGSEALAFEKNGGGYKLLSPPLFVHDLSVDDVINVIIDGDGYVSEWSHLKRSERSVAWMLRLSEGQEIEDALKALRLMGCNTTGVNQIGCYSVDIPENVAINAVDVILDGLDPDMVAVAFPSMRHPD